MAAGIYVHIPFCLQKCFYCDFFSKPEDSDTLREEYTKALLAEIAFYGVKYEKKLKADAIFFGGGTPSLMEPRLISAIIEGIKKNFDISADAEISLECNPATASEENLRHYRECGVNRLSIGAQSFDPEILKGLGRLHGVDDIKETVSWARRAGFDNINLDLMFAVPGQNLAKWEKTIEEALKLEPEHFSFYSLEIAENTVFDKMLKDGSLKETPIETDRKMYETVVKELEKNGYDHYEISNAALPNKECRHNYKYWNFEDYLGLGASAHSFMRGIRFSNVADTQQYIKAMKNQDVSRTELPDANKIALADCVDAHHTNTYEDSIGEYVFTALRTKRGVQFSEFENKMKKEFWAVFRDRRSAFEGFVHNGYAISDSEHIALTPKGIDISNKIMSIFV